MKGNAYQALPADIGPLITEKWREILFGSVVLLLVFRAAWRIQRGINPESLWLDDQWVAALVLHASPSQLLELMPPAPLGFVVLLQAITAVLGWGHWQLQLLPIICGLAQIPLIGWIAWRATGRMSLGLIASILLSGSVAFLVFTVRLKQYTLEGLIVLTLIALALMCAQRVRGAPFTLVIIAAIVALPFSFTAIPAGMVIVNVLALYLFLCASNVGTSPRQGIIFSALAYNAVAIGWLWLVQLQQANGVMYAFWSQHYAPIGDPAAMVEFTRVHVKQFLAGALPPMLTWMLWMVPLGIVAIFMRELLRMYRQRRGAEDNGEGRSPESAMTARESWIGSRTAAIICIGLGFALFYGGMLALSALETYPLGGRRTDIFSYPITILAVIAGIWACSQYLRSIPVIILGIVVARMLLFFPHPGIRYPANVDRDSVQTLDAVVRDGDGVIIGPQSSWAIACYSDRPVELVRTEHSSNGFLAYPQCDRIVVLSKDRQMLGYDMSEDLLARPIEPLLDQRPERIWLVSMHRRAAWVPQWLEPRGYEVQQVPGTNHHVMAFQPEHATPPERRAMSGEDRRRDQ